MCQLGTWLCFVKILHRLFLLGLKKYGKGDWRNISRNFVITRTPTQVASHAQKYFIRQLSGGKDKRRASIHDITTVNLTETTRTSSEDSSKRSTSPQHSVMLSHQQQQQQQPISSAASSGMNFQWSNQSNAGIAMALNPAHEQVFVSPYGLNSYGFKVQGQSLHRSPLHESSYLGPQTPNMVFQMQPSQHYSHAWCGGGGCVELFMPRNSVFCSVHSLVQCLCLLPCFYVNTLH